MTRLAVMLRYRRVVAAIAYARYERTGYVQLAFTF